MVTWKTRWIIYRNKPSVLTEGFLFMQYARSCCDLEEETGSSVSLIEVRGRAVGKIVIKPT